MYTRKLNSFHLKIIAIIAMTINHLGQNFAPQFNPFWWEFFYEFIGKLTFPIMAYLLVEGYSHTSRFSNYVKRLVLFAFLSVVPYHLVITKTGYLYIFNNILFTLTIGLLMLKIMDLYPKYEKPILILASTLTLGSDWNAIGILIIYSFKKKSYKLLTLITLSLTLLQFITSYNPLSFTILGILIVIPLLKSYNGQKGFSNKLIKYGFYLYYPLHLTILFLAKVLYETLQL